MAAKKRKAGKTAASGCASSLRLSEPIIAPMSSGPMILAIAPMP